MKGNDSNRQAAYGSVTWHTGGHGNAGALEADLIQILPPPLVSCVFWARHLNLSETPPLPDLENEDKYLSRKSHKEYIKQNIESSSLAVAPEQMPVSVLPSLSVGVGLIGRPREAV